MPSQTPPQGSQGIVRPHPAYIPPSGISIALPNVAHNPTEASVTSLEPPSVNLRSFWSDGSALKPYSSSVTSKMPFQTPPQGSQAIVRPHPACIPSSEISITIFNVAHNPTKAPSTRPQEPPSVNLRSILSNSCAWNIALQLIFLILTCVGLWYAAESLSASKKGAK